MMASRCITSQYFLNPRLFLWLLAHVLTMTWHFSVTESAAQIQLRGEVGGNVTFHCPVDKQKTIRFFYFQKDDLYVNGYHTSLDMVQIPTWKNTRLDRNNTAVHMYHLNISHSGDYHCVIQYSDKLITTVIHLSLTATYSKPEVAKHCSDGCLVTCFSRGGYPGAKVEWNVSDRSRQMCKVVNSSEMEDPGTMTFNSSSTAYFNCSSGELKLLSCSVGNVTSDLFSVCTPKPTGPDPNPPVLIAICGVLLFTFIVAFLLWWKCKTSWTVAAAVDVTQGRRTDGYEEEATTMVAIGEKNGGEEGS